MDGLLVRGPGVAQRGESASTAPPQAGVASGSVANSRTTSPPGFPFLVTGRFLFTPA